MKFRKRKSLAKANSALKPESNSVSESNSVPQNICDLIPHSSLRLTKQFKTTTGFVIRGEIDNFALHWEFQKHHYPTVTQGCPTCNGALVNASTNFVYLPLWRCNQCVEIFNGVVMTKLGVNVNLTHYPTAQDFLEIINEWTDRTLNEATNLDLLRLTFIQADVQTINEWFMDQYRLSVLEQAVQDLSLPVI